ncbi:MAG: hypothetical protein AAF517_02650 [Planctomycetota bacterium]
MWISKLRSALVLFTVFAVLFSYSSELMAQRDRTSGRSRSAGDRTRSGRGSSRSGSSRSGGLSNKKRPSSKSGSTKLDPKDKKDEKDAKKKDEEAEAESGGMLASIKTFVRENKWTVLGGLGAALAAAGTFIFLSGKKKKDSGEFLEGLDEDTETDRKARRSRGGARSRSRAGSRSRSGSKSRSGKESKYSSTQIRAADVNERVGKGVEGQSIETDQEYALVVDEDALTAGLPEVDESTGNAYAPEEDIRENLAKKDFDSAYDAYCAQIDTAAVSEFHSDVEHQLSEHFLGARQFDKAARILEHHVATHAKRDIVPQVYFNLGYLHVLSKTYNKSRRFFKLYCENEADPQRVDRARGILQSLDSQS